VIVTAFDERDSADSGPLERGKKRGFEKEKLIKGGTEVKK